MSSGLRRFAVPGAPGLSPGDAPQDVPAQDTARQEGAWPDPDAKRPVSPATVLEKIRTARESETAPEEACEMCAAPIAPGHGHVADLEQSSLLCTCRACYLLFERPEAGRRRWRAVPDRYLHDPARPMTAAEWDELEIPVGLAFFLRSSQRDELAGFYPSPAGATECRLDLAAWNRIARAHPLLGAIEPDVEAALISRTGDTVEHFVVPIDACYELAGRMRMLWKGFDGGTEARASIAEFLDQVRSRAREFTPGPSGTEPS